MRAVKKVKRLYSEFQPEHYELAITPNKDKMTFVGTVKILGKKTGRPSQRITLHQKDLAIKSAALIKNDKRRGKLQIKVDRINKHSSFDELRLHAGEMLYPGEYELTITFSGKITEQMHGIYPCNFMHNGKDKKLIATQFESHYAREVFPCIDEPEAKATFDLILNTSTGETVLGNTPVKKQTKNGEFVQTIFETTPKMSTYLLAFAHGELGYREAKTKDGIIVRTYATPDNAKYTEFAVETAVKCLEFYNEYFGIPYPLPKLDMIALPDFSSGAMENWGLVTYREQALLVDPANTSIEMKQYVAMVIAHELAHQWFGNLVTMSWWTDLWLNEGFASWIEYLACAELFPQWHMWTQYIVEDQFLGLRSDSLANSHPVSVTINHPDEIRTIFDDISYQKGSAVIHMLQAYLGGEVFRNGLRYYLKKYAYKNTETEDLWAALEEVSGKPVRDFMHVWIGETGYPLVEITNDKINLKLKQQRFFASQEINHASTTLWPVPLNSGPLSKLDVLDTATVKVPWAADTPLINEGHSGFYITTYDKETYANFGLQIEAGALSETERLGLLFDAFSASRAGYLGTPQVLGMLKHYHAEHSAPVWDTISLVLGDIRRVFDDEELLESMKPYLAKISAEQVGRLGWKASKSETYFDTLLRPIALGLSSIGNNPDVVKEALKRFESIKKSEDQDPDLRSVIYYAAARNGGKKEFEKLKMLYEKTHSPTEKIVLAGALCAFKQPEIYKESLKMINSPLVRIQDISYWIVASFSNRHAKLETWAWMKENWKWLEQSIGAELGFARLPLYAARAFANKKFRDDFVKFFEPQLTPSLRREYKKALETVEWQTAWRNRDLKDIKDFFVSQI